MMPSSNTNRQWRSWNMEPLAAKQRRDAVQQQQADEAQFEQQSELRQLREQARQEAYEEGLKAGREAGFQAGHEEGLELGREAGLAEYNAQLKTALTPLGELIKEADAAVQGMDAHLSESLLQLALTVGRQLAGEALAANPEQVLELIRAILHEDPMLTDKPVLLLNPEDLELVKEHLEQEISSVGWKLRVDDRLERGGCRLVSANGELDATIETRWQRIVHQLRGRHG
jgi:Flagellar biosynthesis/type III secretory pathway protein